MFDFKFLDILAEHPKTNSKIAIQTLDILAKAHIYEDVFYKNAMNVFLKFAFRFKDDPLLFGFVHQLLKVIINIYIGNTKKENKASNKKIGKYLAFINAKIEDNKAITDSQCKRILELIIGLLELGCSEITEKVKLAVLEGNYTIKSITKENDVPLLTTLSGLGDVAEMQKKFESSKPPIKYQGNSPKYNKDNIRSVPISKKNSIFYIKVGNSIKKLIIINYQKNF